MHTPLVQDQATLADFVEHWQKASALSLDTEFVREKTYFPQLCLIQISDGQNLACIDCLSDLDIAPVLSLLESGSRTSLFHAPGQDLEILVQLHDKCPAALFDSQLAASLLGLGDQMGYAALIKLRCGVTLDKTLSRTNWARRPLNEREIAYAAADVSHLIDIYPQLREELAAAGRLSWHEEDCQRMCDADRYRPKPELEWKRLKGLSRIEARGQHVAAKLCEWREIQAIDNNRPRRWIMADDAIYSMAERQPRNIDQLKALGLLSPKQLDRHGKRLIELVAEGAADHQGALAMDHRTNDVLIACMKRLAARVRNIAEELGIPASLLAPRSDIELLATQGENANIPLLEGWRKQVAGEVLLSLL